MRSPLCASIADQPLGWLGIFIIKAEDVDHRGQRVRLIRACQAFPKRFPEEFAGELEPIGLFD